MRDLLGYTSEGPGWLGRAPRFSTSRAVGGANGGTLLRPYWFCLSKDALSPALSLVRLRDVCLCK